ncbi:MAG: hypothetical protein OXD32_04830 [Endozoicomonadaceae bacterium]|nr:hypothetical protein [Endozoicomonadaceae bacterium]MCY4329120.1 hypothetical protein [Endozoicomonadaceae bacterium]
MKAGNIGNIVRYILFRPTESPTGSKEDGPIKGRIKRKYVPNVFVRGWLKIEGKSIQQRTATIMKYDGLQPVYAKVKPVQAQKARKKFEDMNEKAITEFVQDHQKQYLERLSYWKKIKPEQKNNPHLMSELQKRTSDIARWFAYEPEGGSPPYMPVSKIFEGKQDSPLAQLQPKHLCEATNIALRTMLEESLLQQNSSKYKEDDTLSKSRIYPDDFTAVNPKLTSQTSSYTDTYFPFDQKINQDHRPGLFDSWIITFQQEGD